MARKPTKKPAAPPVDQLHERAYGPGQTASLYNGQASVLSPQLVPAQNTVTDSGMNSPSAAPASAGLGFYGSVQASLQPAGPANPMTIYDRSGARKFPLGDADAAPSNTAPIAPAKSTGY